MEKYMEPNKLMTMKEAINKFVKDGDSFVFANCLTGMPLATVHEIIRSGKKGMMVFQQGGIEELDLLVEAGTVDRVALAYNFRSGGKRVQSPLDRAIKEKRIKLEEFTNFTLLSMMKAGAMGYPLMPVLSGIRVTDVVQKRGFFGKDKFAEITDPFSGQKILVVKAQNPDFALMHVQRADKAGNGQLWGAMINSKWAALAAKKIILTAEKIVDSSVINSSPHLTIAPAHKVCAVIECPWGAHPCEMAGHYDSDIVFRALFWASIGSSASMKAWMDEWIYNIPDRKAYIDHYTNKFGKDAMESRKATPFLSVPADYGFTFTKEWDENGYSKEFGMNMEQFEHYLDEKGALIQS